MTARRPDLPGQASTIDVYSMGTPNVSAEARQQVRASIRRRYEGADVEQIEEILGLLACGEQHEELDAAHVHVCHEARSHPASHECACGYSWWPLGRPEKPRNGIPSDTIERSRGTKLTDEQRKAIVVRYVEGRETAADLAAEYGVSKATIYNTVSRYRVSAAGLVVR